MALIDRKITDAERNANYVQSVEGSKLNGSISENKAVFDKYPELIRTKFNNLIDELITDLPLVGHKILDEDGVELTQRPKLKFTNSTVEDDGECTIVQGLTGPQGLPGVSPTITSSKQGTVTTITITTAAGTQTIQLHDGVNGSGTGDMTKAVYDADDDGVVDNAEALNGQPASYYAAASSLPTKLSDLTDDLGSTPTHTHSQYLTSSSIAGLEEKGKVTIGATQYTIRTGSMGAAGYITIEVEE